MARVRYAAAALLAASVLMPQYSCAEYRDLNGKLITAPLSAADSGKYKTVDVDHYVITEVDPDDPASYGLPVIYLWPLAFAFLLAWRPRALATRIVDWVEPVLLGFGLYVILIFPMGTRRYGNYLAVAAAATLFVVSSWEWVVRFRQWRAARAAAAAA